MNTHDSSATVRARVGLVELPELAGMLQNAGLQTITGPGFREAATEIKEGFKESTFPIIVADASTPGLRAWIQRIHNTAASAGKPVHIAVVRGEGDPVIVSEDVIELRTPLTLNEILAAVKVAPVPAGDVTYPAPVAVPESAGIDFDFDFDDLADEEPAPAVAPKPVVQAPAAEALPWEAPAASVPAESSAPAAALPWETPAPAASAAPWETEPPATKAPVADGDLDWAAPVASTPAPAATEEFDWGTPAPAAAAAPVNTVATPAPDASGEFDWDTPGPASVTPTADAGWEDPAPAATPADSSFEWGTPASESAPDASDSGLEWDTPAVAQPAPARVAEFEWAAAAPSAEPAAPAEVQPTAPVEDEWDSAFPTTTPPAGAPWDAPIAPSASSTETTEWDSAFPAPQAADIDWGTPAGAQEAPLTPQAHEPAVINGGNPAAQAAPVAERTIDWGTPAAAPVPETDRPEPRTEQRTFTPAPPAAAQTPVPAPVAPVQQAQAEHLAPVRYLDPAQNHAARYAAPAQVQQMTQDWPGQAPQRTQPSSPQGELIVDYSGKGGVGKSTTSLRLATIAADAGLKVILIDGNAAQGDLRTYMKLHRSNLPTIYDAAFGDVSKAVLHPDVINENREPTLGRVNFAFVAAAPDEIYDKDIVTDAVYGQVIEYARHHADLVILDTQIVEAADRSGVVDDIILPALIQDGWGIGISDMSSPGVNNLNHRLHKFISAGVPTERLMVLLNRVPEDQVSGASKASAYFQGRAKFLGVIEEDFKVSQDMNAGRMQVTNANLNAALNEALYTITGNEAFVPVKEEPAEVGRSIFKRFFSGGKKEVA